MLLHDELHRVAPGNRNTFGHALLVHYEGLIDACTDRDEKNFDMALLRLFLLAPDEIVSSLNLAMPTREQILDVGARMVPDSVGHTFHRSFRMQPVTQSAHLDTAIYCLLRGGANLFWKALADLGKVVNQFCEEDKADWAGFIAAHESRAA